MQAEVNFKYFVTPAKAGVQQKHTFRAADKIAMLTRYRRSF